MNDLTADFHHVARQSPTSDPTYASRFLTTAKEQTATLVRSKVIIDPHLASLPETHQAYQALDQLHNTHGQFYTSTVVDQYLKVLSDIFKERCFLSTEGVVYQSGEPLKPLIIALKIFQAISDKPEVTDIAIPYDNNQHHVVIYIDRTQKQVEYYDPQGIESSSPKSDRGLDFRMQDQLEAIRQIFFGLREGRIIENKTAHQRCLHACGLWGLHYIDRRLRGWTVEQIESEGYSEHYIDLFKINEVAKSIRERALLIFDIASRIPRKDEKIILFD